MQFDDSDEALSSDQVDQVEKNLGLKFPDPVKRLYLNSNEGSPSSYVFTNANIDTVVSELLPLTSKKSGTSIQSYEHLVLRMKLVPQELFPFAIDGGGDYFFVDCSSSAGKVYFYRSESSEDNRLINLGLDFEEFWESLTPE